MSAEAEADVALKDFKNIFSLDGKVAVVTGGSRGLGLHAASGLLQAGAAKVFITARNADTCRDAVEALNKLPVKGKAYSAPADVSTLAGIQALVKEVEKETDHVDILFANAGAQYVASFEESTEEGFSNVMDLNVNSVFFCAQQFAPLLRTKGSNKDPSRIIINASIAGIGLGAVGKMATYAYSVSKAAAIHICHNLALELGPQGILVTSLAPGFFPSKMSNDYMDAAGGVDAVGQAIAKATPDRRLGNAEDIAAAVVYLASRAGSHINGSTIILDGGSLISANA